MFASGCTVYDWALLLLSLLLVHVKAKMCVGDQRFPWTCLGRYIVTVTCSRTLGKHNTDLATSIENLSNEVAAAKRKWGKTVLRLTIVGVVVAAVVLAPNSVLFLQHGNIW